MSLCKCGCGAEASLGRLWIRGHNATLPKVMTPARLAAAKATGKARRVPIRERFAKYLSPMRDGCVEWAGAKARGGYGHIYDNGRLRMATHVALELAGKPRPYASAFALHTCDNPACVNAAHLWWGSHSENMKDCFAKSRGHIAGLAIGWKFGRGGVPA